MYQTCQRLLSTPAFPMTAVIVTRQKSPPPSSKMVANPLTFSSEREAFQDIRDRLRRADEGDQKGIQDSLDDAQGPPKQRTLWNDVKPLDDVLRQLQVEIELPKQFNNDVNARLRIKVQNQVEEGSEDDEWGQLASEIEHAHAFAVFLSMRYEPDYVEAFSAQLRLHLSTAVLALMDGESYTDDEDPRNISIESDYHKQSAVVHKKLEGKTCIKSATESLEQPYVHVRARKPIVCMWATSLEARRAIVREALAARYRYVLRAPACASMGGAPLVVVVRQNMTAVTSKDASLSEKSAGQNTVNENASVFQNDSIAEWESSCAGMAITSSLEVTGREQLCVALDVHLSKQVTQAHMSPILVVLVAGHDCTISSQAYSLRRVCDAYRARLHVEGASMSSTATCGMPESAALNAASAHTKLVDCGAWFGFTSCAVATYHAADAIMLSVGEKGENFIDLTADESAVQDRNETSLYGCDSVSPTDLGPVVSLWCLFARYGINRMRANIEAACYLSTCIESAVTSYANLETVRGGFGSVLRISYVMSRGDRVMRKYKAKAQISAVNKAMFLLLRDYAIQLQMSLVHEDSQSWISFAPSRVVQQTTLRVPESTFAADMVQKLTVAAMKYEVASIGAAAFEKKTSKCLDIEFPPTSELGHTHLFCYGAFRVVPQEMQSSWRDNEEAAQIVQDLTVELEEYLRKLPSAKKSLDAAWLPSKEQTGHPSDLHEVDLGNQKRATFEFQIHGDADPVMPVYLSVAVTSHTKPADSIRNAEAAANILRKSVDVVCDKWRVDSGIQVSNVVLGNVEGADNYTPSRPVVVRVGIDEALESGKAPPQESVGSSSGAVTDEHTNSERGDLGLGKGISGFTNAEAATSVHENWDKSQKTNEKNNSSAWYEEEQSANVMEMDQIRECPRLPASGEACISSVHERNVLDPGSDIGGLARSRWFGSGNNTERASSRRSVRDGHGRRGGGQDRRRGDDSESEYSSGDQYDDGDDSSRDNNGDDRHGRHGQEGDGDDEEDQEDSENEEEDEEDENDADRDEDGENEDENEDEDESETEGSEANSEGEDDDDSQGNGSEAAKRVCKPPKRDPKTRQLRKQHRMPQSRHAQYDIDVEETNFEERWVSNERDYAQRDRDQAARAVSQTTQNRGLFGWMRTRIQPAPAGTRNSTQKQETTSESQSEASFGAEDDEVDDNSPQRLGLDTRAYPTRHSSLGSRGVASRYHGYSDGEEAMEYANGGDDSQDDFTSQEGEEFDEHAHHSSQGGYSPLETRSIIDEDDFEEESHEQGTDGLTSQPKQAPSYFAFDWLRARVLPSRAGYSEAPQQVQSTPTTRKMKSEPRDDRSWWGAACTSQRYTLRDLRQVPPAHGHRFSEPNEAENEEEYHSSDEEYSEQEGYHIYGNSRPSYQRYPRYASDSRRESHSNGRRGEEQLPRAERGAIKGRRSSSSRGEDYLSESFDEDAHEESEYDEDGTDFPARRDSSTHGQRVCRPSAEVSTAGTSWGGWFGRRLGYPAAPADRGSSGAADETDSEPSSRSSVEMPDTRYRRDHISRRNAESRDVYESMAWRSTEPVGSLRDKRACPGRSGRSDRARRH